MNFTTKVVQCDSYEEVVAKIDALEHEWVWALLSRFNVSQSNIERAKNDPLYPKYEWRDYLLANFGIQVENDFGQKKTIVKRTNLKKGDTIVVGEWSRPEIIMIKNGSQKRYEVRLKYFNLI
jgi:hypothetical protein